MFQCVLLECILVTNLIVCCSLQGSKSTVIMGYCPSMKKLLFAFISCVLFGLLVRNICTISKPSYQRRGKAKVKRPDGMDALLLIVVLPLLLAWQRVALLLEKGSRIKILDTILE